MHDKLVLFMFFLVADLTELTLYYVTDRFCRGGGGVFSKPCLLPFLIIFTF